MVDLINLVQAVRVLLLGLVDVLAETAYFYPALAPQRIELPSHVLLQHFSHLLVVLVVLVVVELALLASLPAEKVLCEVGADEAMQLRILAEDAVCPV